jgi:hypothetical protein
MRRKRESDSKADQFKFLLGRKQDDGSWKNNAFRTESNVARAAKVNEPFYEQNVSYC